MHIKTLRKILEQHLVPDEARIHTSYTDSYTGTYEETAIFLGIYMIGFEVEGKLYLINRKYWNRYDGITIKNFAREFKLNEKKILKAVDNWDMRLTWNSDKHIQMRSAILWLEKNGIDYSRLVTDKIDFKDLEGTIANSVKYLWDRSPVIVAPSKTMEQLFNTSSSRASNLITSLIKPTIITNMMADQCYQHLSHFHLETL